MLMSDHVQAMAGYRVLLVGHSLGAGAAAILAIMLRDSGLHDVTCYAFACPPCMEPELAAGVAASLHIHQTSSLSNL